ncbi:MAG: hypothetical protein KBT47_00800, partial [Armatimonadetes bacterium]|nr:hypothetical protein [Candidatus Hippobium faecium]
IGHGYVPDEMHPFQRVINFYDGYEEAVCCPYDENFRKHMSEALETVAKHCRTTIMIDDDFRLLFRPGRGCGCPLHMAEFNKRAGTDFSREELFELVSNPDTPEKKEYKKIFLATQKDSLVECAKEYRKGIDRIDSKIQGCFCTAGYDPAGDTARILAGEGNPSILRINNGNYSPAGARGFAPIMFRAAQQKTLDCNKADIYLAETDTCPQLRYSTGAMSLHSHFTGSILEGVNGAKHWITKLNNYEPESGVAYRKVLGKYAGFYNYLSAVVPTLKWRGARIPLAKSIDYDFANFAWGACPDGWLNCVLERLGLPMYFGTEGKTAFLDYETDIADTDMNLTDDDIKEMLKGWTFMSSAVADRLNRRGFGDFTGVKVEEYDGPHLSGEIVFADNKKISVQCKTKKIIPTDDSVEALSDVYHLERGTEKISMFPGVTKYKNAFGGTSVVFCGTPTAAFHYTEAFSYLSMSRKLQLTQLLREAGELPVYYPEDAEVCMKAADMEDGSLFVAIFNIGLDPIEEFPLIFDREIKSLEMLTPE